MDDPFPPTLIPSIRKFLADDHQRPVGQDLYPDVFYTDMFFPLQRQRELKKMMQLCLKLQPKVVMEIGSDKGGGLYHWCKLPSVQRVIACEIRGTPYAPFFEETFSYHDFFWIGQSSYDPATIATVRSWLGSDKIDMLFIDGDKGAFEQDFDAYLPMMNPNGIVFMHDIQDREPTKAYWSVVERGYKHIEIIDTSESLEAIERERQKSPVNCPYEGWLRYWRGQSCGVGVIFLGDQI